MRGGNDKKVGVVFRSENGRLVHGGEVRAKQGCWSLLKGGIVPNVSGPVDIFFEVQHYTRVFMCIFSVLTHVLFENRVKTEKQRSLQKICH